MSELKIISPMLDNFAVGSAVCEHHGVACFPAMENDTNNKYIVKVISVPASRTQLDALLLTGAYPDEASALVYFKEVSDSVVDEINVLNRLAQQEGFLGYEQHQLVPMDDSIGFNIYLLGAYKRTLARQLQKQPLTHLGALNLALDMCAALTVSRRYGYLYVDLKPENIYVMEGGSFRIGDLGFLRMDSLKYTSLPDKYRNDHTAPEIADAFCELNTTIDVYALGSILYQIYNNGELPVFAADVENFTLSAPANADYELSEIILKACAADPNDRWEDPAQMGQAIVSYMQRNGANDTPIVPPVIEEPEVEEPEFESEEPEATDLDEEFTDTNIDDGEEADESEATELPVDPELQEIAELLDADNDETDPSFNEDQIDYDAVSEEISEILSQADEIAEHPVPDPVIAPDPIEVTIPESIEPVEEESKEPVDTSATIAVKVDEDENDESEEEPADESEESNVESDEDLSSDEADDEEDEISSKPVKKSHWLRNTILILVLLGLLTAGYFFYTRYYVLPIESVVLDGSEDKLTVQVTTQIDENLLTVVCKDQHGNQLTAPLKDGVATFQELIPDTGYTVTLAVEGFHKLTGDFTKAYSTPAETNIAQFSAVAGFEDGSVILAFTVEGRDASEWNVVYYANGEEAKTVAAQNKSATITGLTLDKEYTFELQPNADLYVTGQTSITFKATKLAYAQDLVINSCVDGKLTISWNAPADINVEKWNVHCTDGNQYAEVIDTATTTAEFAGIEADKEYTITVTAAGMSVNKQVIKAANAVSLTNVKLEEHATYADLTWECDTELDEDWFVSFTVDGLASTMTSTTDEGYFRVPYIIPGSVYRITIKGENGTEPLGGTVVFTAKDATDYTNEFDGKKVTTKDMTFSLCTPPSWNYWKHSELDTEDYTTEFKIGQKAGVILQVNTDYGSSWEDIVRVFAVYDSDNKLVACGFTTASWSNMLSNGYCALDIPFMPETTGEYTLKLFFDGQFVTEQAFKIVE